MHLATSCALQGTWSAASLLGFPTGSTASTAPTEHSITACTTDGAGAFGTGTVQHASQPRVCYYGASPDTIYDNLGHAEVTQVTLRGSEEEQKEQVLVPRMPQTLLEARDGLCIHSR